MIWKFRATSKRCSRYMLRSKSLRVYFEVCILYVVCTAGQSGVTQLLKCWKHNSRICYVYDIRMQIPSINRRPLLYVTHFELRCCCYCSLESWDREGVLLLPLGQIPLSQVLRSPVYLAHAFTVSLTIILWYHTVTPYYYDTILWHHTMVPAGFLTIAARSCSDDRASEW